jgi:imidazolonepropionase-like amidohydrolase
MKSQLAIALSVLTLTVGLTTDLAAQDLVLTNVRVIVGTGRVIESGSIVVRGGRIASVAASAVAVPGAPVIDGRGLTAVPGFIDGHRHIIPGDADEYFKTRAAAHMREFLEAGYTTLLEGGGAPPSGATLREMIDSGRIKGPRILTSGRADPARFKTAEAARQQVRALAKARVDFIKAAISPQATPEEVEILRAVVDEGTQHDLATMVHAVSPRAMLAAVESGTQKLVHTPHFGWLTDADAKAVRDAGVDVLSCAGFGVPVFGVFNQANVPTFRDGKPWPDAIIEGEGRGREAGYKAVNARTLWDNGVVYGFGTDTGYLPIHGLAHELRTLNLMFSPSDLIRLMGPNTAAFLDREQDIGTLETGKLADIVLLGGNPLEGYWHLLDARVVIKGGEVVVDKR